MSLKNKRKAKYALCLITSLLLFLVLFIVIGEINSDKVSNPTETNASVSVGAPQFSKESGFYSEPFYLRISVPTGTKVYYTLDSSDPDENSIEYTDPIYLEDATKNENVYSMRTDVSTGFYTDLIEEYKTLDSDPQYVSPDYNVDKCNVVRAVAIDNNGDKSSVVTNLYFIGVLPNKYNGCNIVSVVTNPDNLFDKDKGIYVTGSTFEKYISNNSAGSYWRFWEANYRNKGKKWEREASFTFFDYNGKLLLNKSGGIRTQGGVSRGALPRSINLYSRNEYDNSEVFNYNLFSNDNSFYPHSITLASGGNQTITQFNDIMIRDRTNNLNYAVMDFESYVLFLDGEYWGYYRLSSKFDEYYFEHKYLVDRNNLIIIKNNQLEFGNDIGEKEYKQMTNYISNNDMEVGSNYLKACEYIDIDSFIDYYATQIYIARQEDWPNANFALWRTSEKKNNKYSDGKWRWIMFDSNSTSMEADLVNHNTLEFVIENDKMFSSLWENEEFKEKFQARILEIADKCFDKAEMVEYIDNYTEEMYPILSESWKRFYGKNNTKRDKYYETMNSYKEFFDNRKAVVESWFDKE